MGRLNRDPFGWGQYVAIASAYAACYELARNISFSHWMLPAGMRLVCLLLMPRRFWPALAVGEALPVARMGAMHAADYGALWAVLTSIPPILVCMPAVAWIRNRGRLLGDHGQINMAMVMSVALICATVTAFQALAVLTTVVMADGSAAPSPTPAIFFTWLVGMYLGALTLTPVCMALRERLAKQPGGIVTWCALWHSRLGRDAVLIAAPLLAVLMELASQADAGMLQAARMAMALPVVVLTARHGWHGSAIAGMLASIAMASTPFQLQDPAMIQAQAVLAIAISMAVGVMIRPRIHHC